jgi:mRNA-degrading endonuclease RelE of RelBE toxin-antitoxin system
MIYEIKLHPKVDKFIKKSDSFIANIIKKRLKLLRDNPFRYLEHYEGENCYKFRIGDYRALVDVDKTRNIVFIRVLDKRGRVYK